MKLSMSYSQALNDPTYCDTGRIGGAELVKLFGVKPNQAVPLLDVLPHVTISEILWCLRAVKPSMRSHADRVAWKFTRATCMRLISLCSDERLMNFFLAKINGRDAVRARRTLHGDFLKYDSLNKVARVGLVAVEDKPPSQIAINVSQAAITAQAILRPNFEEEMAQRDCIQELLK